MEPATQPIDADLPERTRRRVARKLIPWLFFLYILAYLDRVNIAAASLGIGQPADKGGFGFDEKFIGIASGIFFWGYWILEIPSTLSVVKWGARWVFVRILVLWGICATLCGFLGKPILGTLLGWVPFMDGHDPADQLLILRFLLGFFEGGFFPSVIVYLGLWFRPEDRARAVAGFMAAIPFSNIIGSGVSTGLSKLDWLGLEGWRWIFIVEGVVPIVAGWATLFFLPDRPEKAKWLPADECGWLRRELNREEAAHTSHGHFPGFKSLGLVLLLTFIYFCLNVSSYGLGMFMPSILGSQFGIPKDDIWKKILVSALPFIPALIAIKLNGWHSDKRKEHIWHVAIPLFLQGIGIALAAALDGIGIFSALIMIFWVGSFYYAHLPAFWPIPKTFLGTAVAASAIGFINMIGNLGGSVGPYLVGKYKNDTASFSKALFIIAPFPIVGALLILVMAYFHRRLHPPQKG